MTVLDTHGHGLEIYGSGGWGSSPPRACCRTPRERGFLRFGLVDRLTLGCHLACLSTPTCSVEHVALAAMSRTTTHSNERL